MKNVNFHFFCLLSISVPLMASVLIGFTWALSYLKILHFRWKILKQHVEVDVAEGNTELPPHSLIVKGYDISGFIKADGDPVSDVYVVLSTLNEVSEFLVEKKH